MGVVMDVAALKVSHSVRCDIDATAAALSQSSCNVQPNQLDRPARLYGKGPLPWRGNEHHSTRHLRFNGQGAVDADGKAMVNLADGTRSGKAVRACRNQDLVNGAVADGRGELRDSAHRDFVQMPAVQHGGRHLRRGGPHDGS